MSLPPGMAVPQSYPLWAVHRSDAGVVIGLIVGWSAHEDDANVVSAWWPIVLDEGAGYTFSVGPEQMHGIFVSREAAEEGLRRAPKEGRPW